MGIDVGSILKIAGGAAGAYFGGPAGAAAGVAAGSVIGKALSGEDKQVSDNSNNQEIADNKQVSDSADSSSNSLDINKIFELLTKLFSNAGSNETSIAASSNGIGDLLNITA